MDALRAPWLLSRICFACTHVVPTGSRGFEKVDAQTWAEWGVDYLKYDKWVPLGLSKPAIACCCRLHSCNAHCTH